MLELTLAVMTRAAGVDTEGGEGENNIGPPQAGLQQLFGGGGGGPSSTYNDDDDDHSSICSMTSVGSVPGTGAKSTLSRASRLSASSQQQQQQQQQHHHQQQQQQHQQQQARSLSQRNLEQHQQGDGSIMSPLNSPTESALADFADLPDSASVVCMQNNAPSGVASQNGHAQHQQLGHNTVEDVLPESFVFKVTDEDGRMFRIRLMALIGGSMRVPYPVRALRDAVAAEAGLGDAAASGSTLRYVDDDGDEVTLSSDEGLADAVRLATACEWKSLKVCLSRPSAHAANSAARGSRRSGMSGATAGAVVAVLTVLGVGGFMAMRSHTPALNDAKSE